MFYAWKKQYKQACINREIIKMLYKMYFYFSIFKTKNIKD